MEKHCENEKRFGKEWDGWQREVLVSKAREFLKLGGNAARIELVRTTLQIDQLLREVRS